jgi:hypothetical protein
MASVHGVMDDVKGDPVHKPAHYQAVPGVECIEVTQHFSFLRGNVIKYVWRAGSKGKELEDLKKAAWYLNREIKRLEDETSTEEL